MQYHIHHGISLKGGWHCGPRVRETEKIQNYEGLLIVPGTDVLIFFNIFAEKLAFLLKTKQNHAKIGSLHRVLRKTPENWQKSQKIVLN
jgi:hypothetical protein